MFVLRKFLSFQLFIFVCSASFSQGSLTWATYYGANTGDRVTAVKTDAAGNVYIAGKSESATLMATAGAYQAANAGMFDAFVAKFDANGNRLWSTYIGGSNNDEAFSLAVSANGFVYISGQTLSATGIATGGHQTTFGGLVDAFLAKFNATTGAFVWSTYYGGTAFDDAQAVETDANGNVYITGSTQSITGIAFNAFQNALAGAGDIYLAKFDGNGVLQWGTYYGSTNADYGYGIAANNNDIYVCGFTRSTTGFAFNGFQNTHGGGTNDALLVKFDAATGNRIWASYYGGNIDDTSYDTHIDVNGDIYLVGITMSPNAIASGGHQNTFGGGTGDAFLVKFNAAGNRLWATYYGGVNHDKGESIATDALGNVYIGASSYSPTNIAFQGYQNNLVGTENFYIAKFTSAGVRICATYYGVNKELDGRIAVDANQNIYLAGTIHNGGAGLALSGFQNTNGGGQTDGFLSKFGPCTNIVTANFTASTQSACAGTTINFTNTSTGSNTWNWNFGDGNTSTSQNPSNTYINPGQYTVTLISTDGTTSDTLVMTNYITIHPYAVAAFTASVNPICLGQSITFNNTSSNASSYNWNFGDGNTSTATSPSHAYTNSGNYNVILIAQNANGCNDTLVLPVIVKPHSTSTQNQTICTGASYTLPGGAIVTSAGIYKDTLVAANGCDSIITTNLSVLPAITFSQSTSICNGSAYTLPGGGTTSTAGTYIDTLNNASGCDSIVTTILTVVNAITISQSPVICTGQNYTLPGGNVVSTSGTYIDTLTAQAGCDSIITTILSIVNAIPVSQNASICSGNSYTLPGGNSVNTQGTYTDTLTAQGGCDSIITIVLTVNQTTTQNQSPSICNGSSYLLPGGQTVTAAGIYNDTLTGSNGCDSIIITNLSVVAAIIVSQSANICNGNSYTLPGGAVVNTAGTFVDTLAAQGGCDSIITTNINIKPNASFSINANICAGNSYTLPNGNAVNTSGVYYDTLTAANGCDSTISVTVSVNPLPNATITGITTIAAGQSTTLNATGGVSYNWFPTNDIAPSTGNQITATPSQTIVYCVEVTDNNGCKDTACVTINVEEPCPSIASLAVPNAFSPNGDGENEEFCLQGWTPCNQKFNIRIFDRWGNKVFESVDPNFCWDGIKNGTVMDAQVFVYYIIASFDHSDKKISLKGNITLIK